MKREFLYGGIFIFFFASVAVLFKAESLPSFSLNPVAETASAIDAAASNLIGYWAMDNGSGTTVTDSSATGDNGAFVGGAAWTAGNVGTGAAQFTGTNYITIPDNAAMHFGTSVPFSVSMWIKATGANGTFIDTFTTTFNTPGYDIGYSSSRGLFVDLRTKDDSNGTISDCVIGDINGTTSINDGQWHQIAVVVNRNPTCTTNDAYTYIDHAQQSTAVDYSYDSPTNSDLTGGGAIILGGGSDNFSAPNYGTLSGGLTGALDDVRIYNTALTSDEIAALYQMGTTGASPCSGTTCPAKSCSLTDVEAAINEVNPGNTVTVPAGQCTWTSDLLLTKMITLKGAGSGAGGTEIDYGGTGHTLIDVQAGSQTGKLDISGFDFSGGDPNFWDGTAIQLYGPAGWANARIHDNTFNNNLQYTIKGGAYTDALIDNNLFEGSSGGIELSGQGNTDWTRPLTLGSSDFFFVEHNTFNWADNQANDPHVAVDYANGGRVVFRDNNVINGLFETHDRARDGLPSADAYEVYDNTFTASTGKWEALDIGSGTGVIWGNTFIGAWQYPIGGIDYKTIDTADTWKDGVLPCNGSDPLDQNTSGQTGWLCQYQIGSQNSGSSAVSVPVYIWGNTASGTTSPAGMVVTSGAVHVQQGRDFFNNVSKPGYAPYQYPHPLDTDSNPTPPAVPVVPTQPTNPTPTNPTPTNPTPPNNPAPPDTTPPVISSISAIDITSSSAIITWSTNEGANTQVEYGLTGTYGNTTNQDSSFVTSHSVAITDLSSNTIYHYAVQSQDSSGNSTTSGDGTFTTAAASVVTNQPTPPVSTPTVPITTPAPVNIPPVNTTPTITTTPVETTSSASLSINSVLTTSLYQGLSGSAVTILQTFLAKEGLLSPSYVSGYFGPLTQSSVQAFQTQHAIVSSGSVLTTGYGMVGPKTLAVINRIIQSGTYSYSPVSIQTASNVTSPVSSPTPSPAPAAAVDVMVSPTGFFTSTLSLGDNNAEVKKLQQFLNLHGFIIARTGSGSSGNENTYYGASTANAVTQFQQVYAEYILKPEGLLHGDGTFDATTLRLANEIVNQSK